MLQDEPFAAADLPPLDVAAWRHVMTGLNLTRFVLVAIWWSIVPLLLLFLCTIPAPRWFAELLVYGLALFGMALALILLIAMAFCCAAPAELHTRESARAAFVLTLIGLTTIGMIVAAFCLHEARTWLGRIADVNLLPEIVLGVVFLNFIVAVATWIRFLRSVAERLRQAKLAEDINIYFYLWCFGVWTVICVPLLFLWGSALILETRKVLHSALR